MQERALAEIVCLGFSSEKRHLRQEVHSGRLLGSGPQYVHFVPRLQARRELRRLLQHAGGVREASL